jgi:undecaprenyl-diphosphatase
VVLEVALHIATLLSVLLVYRGEVLRIFRERDWAYVGKLALATAVTVAMILPFKDRVEKLADDPAVVPLTGALLFVTAAWLLLADWRLRQAKPRRPLGWGGAALVGLAQGVAILPGISRSGATIGAALQCGEERDHAARFSFLLSVPVILGAGLLELGEMKGALASNSVDPLGLGVGFVVAMLAGVGAIYMVLWMLKGARLTWFAGYCVLLGIAALVMK